MLKPNQKIIFAGDSITDCDGYVSYIKSILWADHPEWKTHVINRGVSGNTSRDLLGRYERDVLELSPDIVSIMIGINDVWRRFDDPLAEAHLSSQEYRDNLTQMISQAIDGGAKVVLMSPFMIDPNRADEMRIRMDRYTEICRELAKEYSLIFVDIQAMFDRLLESMHGYGLAGDRIHPNGIGQMAIALEFLKAVGYELKQK